MKIGILEGCIRCGRCTRVCPAAVFEQRKSEGKVTVKSPESCIGCGHCVAACPAAAIEHELFGPEKVHPIDRAALPTAEQLRLLMRARRSNRDLKSGPVSEELLTEILEAAHRAPTASNLQQVSYTVLTKREELDEVIEYTLDYMRRMVRLMKMPVVGALIRTFVKGANRYAATFERIIREWEQSRCDRILRGGTTLILIHTPKSNRFGAIDAQLAYQNGSLMAEALGVSQIYTGFLLTALKADKQQRLARRLGIRGEIHAGMALGMPASRFRNYIDKEPLRVQWRR